MVFEDSQSGEELVRTHTGRTRRLYGEPAQTETSFTTGGDQAVAGFIPDSAFSAIREGRDEKLKQSGEHSVLSLSAGCRRNSPSEKAVMTGWIFGQ